MAESWVGWEGSGTCSSALSARWSASITLCSSSCICKTKASFHSKAGGGGLMVHGAEHRGPPWRLSQSGSSRSGGLSRAGLPLPPLVNHQRKNAAKLASPFVHACIRLPKANTVRPTCDEYLRACTCPWGAGPCGAR